MKYATTICLFLVFAGLAAAAPLAPVQSVDLPTVAGLAPSWISSRSLDPILKTQGWDCTDSYTYDDDGNVNGVVTDCVYTEDPLEPWFPPPVD